VVGAEFGTRCSTVVLAGADGRWTFAERRFGPQAAPAGAARFTFAAQPAPEGAATPRR
jgi:uncharacterized protein with NRDE domain